MGDRESTLRQALERIRSLPGITVAAVSPIHETDPVGDTAQPRFLNQAAKLDCDPEWTPRTLLQAFLHIETSLGRVRDPLRRFGPRTIDIDLLLFDDIVLDLPELARPHPRMRERAFVLLPLSEIAPDLVFPDGQTIGCALARMRLVGERPKTPPRRAEKFPPSAKG